MSEKQGDTRHGLHVSRAWALCCVLITALLAGCLPGARTPLPTYTPTMTMPTQTPTTTPVWFPPTATPTQTATMSPPEPTPEMRPGIGDLILDDIFDDPAAWTLQPGGGRAAFGVSELTFTMTTKRAFASAERGQPILADFYLEISANPVLCRGLDEYGLLLRQSAAGDAYRISLSCDSQVRLDRIGGGSAAALIPWAYSPAVPPGGPSISRLGVWIKGQIIRFFINDNFIFEVADPVLVSGRIGLFARSASDEPLTVNFSGLRVYQLEEITAP